MTVPVSRAPIVVVFAALAAGVIGAEVAQPPAAAVAVLLVAGLLFMLLAWRARRGIAVVALGCLAITGAWASASYSGGPEATRACDGELWRARVAGPVERRIHPRTGRLVQRVPLELVEQRCHEEWVDATPAGRSRVRVGLWSGPDVARGDLLQVRLHLTPLGTPRNPGDPDPERWARRTGFVARARVRSAHVVVEPGRGPLAWVDAGRRSAAQRIESVLPPRRAAVAKALALGDRGGIELSMRDRWARAGIAHLLAVSGLHVGLIATLFYFVFTLVISLLPGAGERYSARRLTALATMPAVIGFAVWVGAPASAVRAAVMASAFLVGLAVGRPSTAANALGIAGSFMVLADPMSIYDVGFLLSFAAAAALLMMPRLQPARTLGRRARRAVLAAALASVAATLATAPVTASHFGQVSLIAPVTNIVAVPLGALLATPLTLAFVLLAPMAPWLEATLGTLLALVLALLDGIATLCAALPAAAVDLPRPRPLEIGAYVLLLLAGVGLVKRRHRRLVVLAGVALALIGGSVAWRVLESTGDGRLSVQHPYVGQGDAAVVLLPEGGVLLVDAGGWLQAGDWDSGRAVIAPLLRRLGILTIDLAVLTHPHPDHIGGFVYLAEHFAIRELWYNGEGQDDALLRSIIERVRAGGGQVRLAADLEPLSEREGVRFEIVHPRPVDDPDGLSYYPELSANDNSIVLRLAYGERSILLAGDIEASAEARLAPRLTPVDVIKVPHHGSRTSSSVDLLEALTPRVAVISCGQENRFGFPDPGVVGRYQAVGASVFRTDVDGLVTLSTEGRTWTVAAARGRAMTVSR